MPVTFELDSSLTPYPELDSKSIEDYLSEITRKHGTIVQTSHSSSSYISSSIPHGFVSACVTAYNRHLHLTVRPDDVWITITTSLSRYINANAEALRYKFVDHEGKIQLEVSGSGSLYSANYDALISQLVDLINQRTKGEIKDWIECNFSTTTPLDKVVSQVVLMGVMQQYFSYKMRFECGFPKITLLGEVEDWKAICSKVTKLKEYDATLSAWSDVLLFVLENFIAAFSNKIEEDFWNRVTSDQFEGSGSSYYAGWILSFIGFNEKGRYILKDLNEIKFSKRYGYLGTDDVPSGVVDVPVEIDDHGVEHKTKFYAGTMLATFDGSTISPSLDWAIVDITNVK